MWNNSIMRLVKSSLGTFSSISSTSTSNTLETNNSTTGKKLEIKASSTATTDVVFTMPPTVGTSGQVLKTDGLVN